MDGFLNSKTEKQAIYEIYRACRLCGAGAGYKMPIIQNVVHLDGAEVELKQKIRECVQIEVHQSDKMPPLICELCVDKVNDFYEFLEMCRQTNKRTRLRLGLPPQTMPRGAPDAGDCILGVTEPVFINEDSNEPLSKSSKGKSSRKKEIKKISNNTSKARSNNTEARSLRSKQPSSPRLRGTKRSYDEETSMKSLEPSPKSILKRKEYQLEDNSPLLIPRAKRQRERDLPVKGEETKKVKIQDKQPPRTTRTSPKALSKSPSPTHNCKICKASFDNFRSLNNHMRIHANVKQEKKHIKKDSDVSCSDCKKSFPRRTLLNLHKCTKGPECDACGRHYSSRKSLSRHKSVCVQRKREVYIDPNIRSVLKRLEVRVSRCDPLLKITRGEHYDVSNVAFDFGLDKACIYPYISNSFRVKFEPGYMVNISDDFRAAFDADKYVHWDSEGTDSELELTGDSSKNVVSLTSLSLKTIFSPKCLGKVPKKRRKIRPEKAFDSILNVGEFDSDLRQGIDYIINSLDDDRGKKDKSGDNDSLSDDEKPQTITNNDFDSLFANNKGNNKNDLLRDDKNVNDERPNKDSEEDTSSFLESTHVNAQEENTIDIVINDGYFKNNTRKSEKDGVEGSEVSILEAGKTAGDMDEENKRIEEESRQKDNTMNEVIKGGSNIKKLIEESRENNDNDIMDSNENNDSNQTENVDRTCTNRYETQSDRAKKSDVKSKEKIEPQTNAEVVGSDANSFSATEVKKHEDGSGNVDVVEVEKTDSKEVRDEVTGFGSRTDVNSEKEKSLEDRLSKIVGANEDVDNVTTKNDEKHINGDDENFNMDDLEDLSADEVDDKRLMEALDAQIGEGKDGNGERESTNGEARNENDKIMLEDLVPASVKSNDLDSISDDEFASND